LLQYDRFEREGTLKIVNLTVLFVFLASAAVFTGCSKNSDNRVVARIGWEKITVKDINLRLQDVPAGYREYLMSETGRKQFLDILVRQKIMIAMAKKKGINNRKEIRQAVEDFKKGYEMKVKQYTDELLVESYLKELEETSLKITDGDTDSYYNAHKKEFTMPTEVRLSHILATSEPEAEGIIKKLKAGEGFEDAAKKYSLDPVTADKGGDLGKYKHTEILPEFVPTVDSLYVGGYSSKAVKTPYGWHILKKTSEKVLPTMPREEANQEIRKLILKEKFDKWIDEQKAKLKVKINLEALK